MFWNERYSENGFAYGTEPNDFLRENVERIPAGKVLCLAEGEGRNAVFLAAQGFEVTAIDLSEVGLAKANYLAQKNDVKIKTILADLAEFEIEENAWSGIVSIWAHVPPDLRRKLNSKIVNGLARGGALVYEAYTPRQLEFGTGGPRAHQQELLVTLAELQKQFGKLTLAIAHETTREVHEGKYHEGSSAVVQILAFKY